MAYGLSAPRNEDARFHSVMPHGEVDDSSRWLLAMTTGSRSGHGCPEAGPLPGGMVVSAPVLRQGIM